MSFLLPFFSVFGIIWSSAGFKVPGKRALLDSSQVCLTAVFLQRALWSRHCGRVEKSSMELGRLPIWSCLSLAVRLLWSHWLFAFWAEINWLSPNEWFDLRQMSNGAKLLCPEVAIKFIFFPSVSGALATASVSSVFPQFPRGSKGIRRVSYTGILEGKTIYVSAQKQVLTFSLRCHPLSTHCLLLQGLPAGQWWWGWDGDRIKEQGPVAPTHTQILSKQRKALLWRGSAFFLSKLDECTRL